MTCNYICEIASSCSINYFKSVLHLQCIIYFENSNPDFISVTFAAEVKYKMQNQ